MEKIINKKKISIDVPLFIRAKQGLVGQGYVYNKINITIPKEQIEQTNRIVEMYREVYSKMPYPIQAIEEDIKYYFIASIMEINLEEDMQYTLNNGLIVKIDDRTCIVLRKSSWKIDFINNYDFSKKYSDLDWVYDTTFSQFNWVREQIRLEKTTGTYYQEFFDSLLKACDKKPDILKKELMNILEIEPVPLEEVFDTGVIIDVNSEKVYNMSIYQDGQFQIADKTYRLSFNNGQMNIDTVNISKVNYNFELSKKSNGNTLKVCEDSLEDRIRATVEQLFSIVVSKYNYDITGIKYFAMIHDMLAVIIIQDEIYLYDTVNNKFNILASGVKFISTRANDIYFKCTDKGMFDTSVTEIYKFNLVTAMCKVCSIKVRKNEVVE